MRIDLMFVASLVASIIFGVLAGYQDSREAFVASAKEACFPCGVESVGVFSFDCKENQ